MQSHFQFHEYYYTLFNIIPQNIPTNRLKKISISHRE